MTVQELIDKLQEIQDKDKTIVYKGSWEISCSCPDEIIEYDDKVVLW